MDRYGDDFVPPNPKIGHVKPSKLVFWALLVVGVSGIILSVFVPALAEILGSIFGVCALVGAAGLIAQHKGQPTATNRPSSGFQLRTTGYYSQPKTSKRQF